MLALQIPDRLLVDVLPTVACVEHSSEHAEDAVGGIPRGIVGALDARQPFDLFLK